MEQKFCQSCAMPMTEEAHFGTNADQSKNEEYCCYCYENGAFKQDITMEEMMAFCAPILVREGVCPDEETARASMMAYFPKLKRWASEG